MFLFKHNKVKYLDCKNALSDYDHSNIQYYGYSEDRSLEKVLVKLPAEEITQASEVQRNFRTVYTFELN